MSNRFNKTVSAFAIAILMISTVSFLASVLATPPPGQYIDMWMDPSSIGLNTTTTGVGYTFWVTVWLNATMNSTSSAGSIGAWQFKMIYPNAYLNATQCVYTGTGGLKSQFFESTGTNVYTVTPSFAVLPGNTSFSYVLIGESWSSGPYGHGLGSLAKVQFTVTAAPPKGGNITAMISIHDAFPGDTYALDGTTSNQVVERVYDCAYSFLWIAPPSPYLTITPDTWQNDPVVNVNGTILNFTIKLSNLYAAWYLTNASFTLSWDPGLLEWNTTTIDTASWNGLNTAYTHLNGTGAIDFFVNTTKTLGGSPGPAVKIADVGLKIIGQNAFPPVQRNDTGLNFTNVKFFDHTISIPAGTSLNGHVTLWGLVTMTPPYLQVSPASTVIGPEPSLGTTFKVDVVMKNLNRGWGLVGYNFRLSYDPTLLQVVDVAKGPFLDQTSWGYVLLSGVTIPMATAPTYMGITCFLLNITTTRIGTFKFTINLTSTELVMRINGAITNTFTINSLSPPMVSYVLVELRNYNTTKDITTDLMLIVNPTTWGVQMSAAKEIVQYFDPSTNLTQYPTWWAWLNGTSSYPDHWSLMHWWSLSNWTRNVGMPDYSWFFSAINTDGIYGPHVAVGGLLATDSGSWYIFPEGSGTVATITFKVIKQSSIENLTCALNLFGIELINKDGGSIPFADSQNGTVTVLAYSTPGRQIDLYTQYPSPYGGQGPNMPSDMFWPQKDIILYAYVSYNFWPVQNKLVAYEILSPNGTVWDKRTALTDANGIAQITFRMPWPCDKPESLFGTWNVIATVDIACTVVNDTMQFKYGYLADNLKVTTDLLQYAHGDTVTVTVKFTSVAMQKYTVLVTSTIVDNLGYSIGFAEKNVTIGGIQWCTTKTYTVTFTIQIPKWTAAGMATVHTNLFDKEPIAGGVALCPEYVGPDIWIQPL